MTSARPALVARSSNAFSSFAVTVAMAVLAILAVAFGTVEDSKAASDAGLAVRLVAKATQP
jgi:hypothetical protein